MKLVSVGKILCSRPCVTLTVIIISIAISSNASTKNIFPEIQHYVADWEYKDFRLSPDGETLAYINRRNGEDNVVILNRSDMSLKAGFNSPNSDVNYIYFLTNNHLIVRVTDYRRTQLVRDQFIFNISKNKKIKLNWGSHVSSNSFSSGWMRDLFQGLGVFYAVDEKSAKIAMGLRDKYRSVGLYLADLETGQSTLLERGTKETRSWIVGKGNKPIIRVDIDQINNKRKFFVKRDTWQLLLTTEGISDFRKSLSESQEELYLIRDNLDFSSVLSVSLADGSTQTPLFSEMNRDARDFVRNRNDKLLGVIYGGLKLDTQFLDPKINSAFERLTNSFPRSRVKYISGEDSLEKIIVSISGEDGALDFFLFNTSTLSLVRLKSALPNIKNVAKRELLTYESSDGIKIPAVLRLPVNTDLSAKMPLIVIPHRHGQISGVDWEREADFFSAKGYAVFSPNYRSTDGFGLELLSADIGRKNDLILKDIDDGIKFLSKHYSLDMTRIHMFGYGYGGYLALMSAVSYPNRYKSVAVVDPITDLADFPDWKNGDLNVMFPQLVDSDNAVKDLSPIYYASQIQADVLLISDKKSIYHNQVKNMRKLLKSESKNVYLEVFKTKHGKWDVKVRRKILEKIDSFFES
jgi:dipeptidyl aminopeptidase/acylaminoacyl peptidase